MTALHAVPVRDWDALGRRWRALEARVPASFFQSWTWIGCLASERFPDPMLLEARSGGETTGLALFNRRRGLLSETWALHESGRPALDSPYVEHNGVLGGPVADLLREALATWRPRRLVLSGIDDATLAATRRAAPFVRVVQSREAPFADLAREFLAGRSSNTRQQLRRSNRAYGAVKLRRAADVVEAHAFLGHMAALHQKAWVARGRPGAFAEPFFGRFHHALVERGMPRGEIDLLQVSADGQVIGILYNFRFAGQALAYQSGLDYGAATGPCKPGLTCHHAAIRFASAEGLARYDFLAGGDRYKQSLSDGSVRLHWVEAGSALHPALAVHSIMAGRD